MKDHEVREFVDALTRTAKEHEGCQSLRAALSRVVKETLVNHAISHRHDSEGWDALYGIKRD